MNKWMSIWKYYCPRCRRSPLFVEPFDFSNPLNMHYQCTQCEQLFEPDPGYYFGAMFISYLLTSFILLPLALILTFYFNWTINGTMALVIFLGAVMFLKILRISRSLWIHILVGYKPHLANKK